MLDMVLKGTVQLNNKLLVSVLLAILLVIPMTLAIPENITVQGRLTDDSASPLSGSVSMNFSIYTVPTGGTAAYSLLDQTVNLDDSGVWYHTLYNVNLAFDSEYYLGVSVNGEAEMSPRIVLTSSPYSYVAKKAEGLSGSSDLQVNTINASVAVNTSKICIGDDCRLAWPGYSAKAFSCPANFTLIENNGYVIGCMQDNLESTARTCNNAVDYCFDTYGGRLPSYNEVVTAFYNYPLDSRYTNQLTGDADYFSGTESCIYFVGATWKPATYDVDNAMLHRCFIPASGSTSGWNYNASELNTSLNVTILGDLTLGEGKIAFNSTSKTYEFWNGSVWQEIGTGTAGSGSGSQWNISGSSYIINNSGVLDINETALNNSIDARASSSAAGWVNNSQATSTALNVSLGSKITFALGAIIKNVVNGWLTITGNTVVEGNLNATGDIGLNGGNISYDSGRLLVDGTQLGTEDSRVNIVCPTGFTRIENNGYVLGCMQNSVEGTDACMPAIMDCFNTYGGKLPTYNELYIAKNYMGFDLLVGELLDGGSNAEGGIMSCSYMYPNVSQPHNYAPYSTEYSNSRNYRCFIPAQSGTPWENVTDGISYSQNVSITGDLSARKLCLNGTCFTQLPNQDGITPAFSVRKSVANSFAFNTIRKIQWGVKEIDSNNDFYLNDETDPLTGCNNCFRPSVPGYYFLSATASYSFPTTGQYAYVSIYKDDLEFNRGTFISAGNSGTYAAIVSTLVYANGTNYFSAHTLHSYNPSAVLYNSTLTSFSGARVDSGSPWLLENGNATLDADANITGTLTLGDGKIRYNNSAKAFEFYNGSVWQEIGTGAAGAGSGSQWNIENNYIVNVSDVLSFNETLLNATIDARASSSAAGWVNNSQATSTALNVSLGSKITFALGAIIKNVVSGWMTITGNTIVEGDLNVTGDIGLNGGNISYDSGRLLVDGTQLGVEDSNVNIVCPTGFTRIESQGYVLGCMQNDDYELGSCTTAINTCWTNHGGRLPSYSEAYIARQTLTLTGGDDVNEWIDGGVNDGGVTECSEITPGDLVSSATYSVTTRDYRCFIPAQSGTPWENVTDGISYSQNVSITGDLSARKLCLNGTCFTQLPTANEQDVSFKVRVTTDTCASNAWCTLNMGTEIIDSTDSFDLATETFTVPVAGLYLFSYATHFDGPSDNSGFCLSSLVINGGYHTIGSRGETGSDQCGSTGTTIRDMSAGDTVQLQAWQTVQNGVTVTSYSELSGIRLPGSYWNYTDGNITFTDGNVNIAKELWLGNGRIRFNDTSNSYEFYNGTTWQEIGTGAAGPGSGSQWNIENNYIVNVSDVLSFNETLLNATIDARSSSSGAGWSNTSTVTSTSLDVIVGDKITFALGEMIDNIVDGWLTMAGSLNIMGNVVLQENGYVNFNQTSGTNGYGIRDNNGDIQYKDSNGVWKSLSKQSPTGNVVWTKIWEYDVTDSATQTVVATGLDGDNDIEYKIISDIRGGMSSASNVGLRLNSDTGNNYGHNAITGDQAASTADGGSNPFGYMYINYISDTSHTSFSETLLRAKSGRERIAITHMAARNAGTNPTEQILVNTIWSNTADNIRNITFYGSAGTAMGVGTHLEIWAPRPVEVSSVNIVCPSGFFKLENNGYVLGCMQATRELESGDGTQSCQTAMNDCFTTYGGRLPSYSEIYSAVQNHASAMTDEGTEEEWIDVGHFYDSSGGTPSCGIIHTSANNYQPNARPYTENADTGYRCFIPAQGASSWVNGSAGLGYDGDVNITGTLKLGEGSIRFNSTSAAYEFYNGSDWQEIGTGAAGSGSGDGAGWSNTSTTTSTTLDVNVDGELNVTGNMIIGDGTRDVAGAIRYNAGDFEGYDGSSWTSLTKKIINGTVPISFHVNRNDVAQTGVAISSHVVIDMTNEEFDYGNNYNLTSNRFVAPEDGVYYFSGTTTQVLTAGKGMSSGIVINGATYYRGVWTRSHMTDSLISPVNVIVYLNKGDYAQLAVYQDVSTSGTVGGSDMYLFFAGAKLDSLWSYSDSGIKYDGDVNVSGQFYLGNGSIRFNDTSKAYEFYNGSIWQEIGTGTGDGAADGTGNWTETTQETSTPLNVTVGSKLTFGLGEVIDNIVDGFLTITGNLIVDGDAKVQGNLNVTGNITTDSYVNFNGTEGSNGFGIREENGNIQYKDSNGVWKSLSKQNPTGNVVWTKIWEYDVETATQKIVIDGLDGNSDGQYKLYSNIKNDDDASRSYLLSFNGDTSTSNYYQIYGAIKPVSTLIADSLTTFSGIRFGFANAYDSSFSELTLQAKNGSHRAMNMVLNRYDEATKQVEYTQQDSGIWENSVANIVNITLHSDPVSNLGIGSHFELWAPRPVEVSNVNIVCPTGFTKIENNGYVLGCMQNDENTADTCHNAIEYCFDNYGGKLPSYSELKISFNNFVLNSEGGNEWYDVGYYFTGPSYYCGLHGMTGNPSGGAYDSSYGFRCFIPAQGASSWVNGSAGLGYDGDVNITGTLKLGEGSIRFNSTSAAYEFYNGSDWQEIGTGAAGSGSGDGAGWSNTSTVTSTSLNVQVTGNITPGTNDTYTLGTPDNVWKEVYVGNNSLWIGNKKISNDGGKLVWDGMDVNLNGTNLSVDSYVNFNGTEGTNGFGFREENGKMQYKDADGVWKSLSTQTPTGNVVWTKIWEYDVEETTHEIDILGLDGNADSVYKLYSQVKSTASTTNNYFLYMNSDETTNYGFQHITGENTVASANRGTSSPGYQIALTDTTSDFSTSDVTIYAKNGTNRVAQIEQTRRVSGTTVQSRIVMDMVWPNSQDNIVNMTIRPAQANSIAAGSHFELWAPRPVEVSNVNIVCPTGFTKIQNNGYVLGCMQNNEEGNGFCTTAMNDCFTTYGGRLPSYSEIYVAFQNYNLAAETDGSEWIDTGYYGDAENRCGYINLAGTPSGDNYDNNVDYRCFIPAQGASSWVNGSAGLGYEGDVNITGTLKLGDGSIRFNSTNAAYEFYNGSNWQEIGTGAAGSSSGSQWNIENNYLVNVSDVLSFNETLLNTTIDARASLIAGIWDNISGTATYNNNVDINGNTDISGSLVVGNTVDASGDVKGSTFTLNGEQITDWDSIRSGVQTTGYLNWEIDEWIVTGQTLPSALYSSTEVVINDTIYLISGWDNSIYTQKVFYAKTSDLTSWTTTGNVLPQGSGAGSAVVVGDKIYYYGGYTGSSVDSDKISYADISDLTSWTDTGKTLPSHLTGTSMQIIGDKIYAFGGRADTTYLNKIYYANVSDPTTWADTISILPRAIAYPVFHIIGEQMYLFGGSDGSGQKNTILYANVSTPTIWVESSDTLPASVSASNSLIVGDKVYLFGGQEGSASSTIYYAYLSEPTKWYKSTSVLPEGILDSSIAVIGNKAYIFGGYTSGTVNKIYSADLSLSYSDTSANISNLGLNRNWTTRSNTKMISQWQSNGSTMYTATDIRVGINTSTPNGTFDIDGSLCLSGDCITSWNDVSGVGGGSSDGAGWSNTSESTNTTLNVSIGSKLTFAFGEVIDNIVDGWLTITGNLIVEGNLNVTGNITTDKYVNFNGTDGSNGFGIREENGMMQYKDADGVWKSLSTQSPTGNVVWTKIWEYDVESATNEVVITGLDGNIDGNYKFYSTIETAGASTFQLRFNEQNTGYSTNAIQSNGASAGVDYLTSYSGIYLGNSDAANKKVASELLIYAKNGTSRASFTKYTHSINGNVIDTFGTGIYIWNNQNDNIVNMSIVATAGSNFINSGSHFELWAPRPVEVSNVNIVCPTGFTKIENNGYVLGCMQNNEEASNVNCNTAITGCFSKYGGRLPTYAEAHIAFSQYSLSGVDNDFEWIDSGYWADSVSRCGSIYSSGTISGSDAASGSNDYRCFIPAQGVSEWTKIPFGMHYNKSISIQNRIGIGTQTPAYGIDVQVGSGTAAKFTNGGGISGNSPGTTYSEVVIDSADSNLGMEILGTSTSNQRIVYSDNEYARGQIEYDHNNNAMGFYTNATEKMSIDKDGNVGIGTNNPTEKLEVKSGSQSITMSPEDSTINTTGGTDLYITSSNGNVIVKLG